MTIDLANQELLVSTNLYKVMPYGKYLIADYAMYTDRNFYLVGRLNTTEDAML